MKQIYFRKLNKWFLCVTKTIKTWVPIKIFKVPSLSLESESRSAVH